MPKLIFIKIILLIFLVNFTIKSQEFYKNESNFDSTTISKPSNASELSSNYLNLKNVELNTFNNLEIKHIENTPENTIKKNLFESTSRNLYEISTLNPKILSTTLSSTEIINEILNELDFEAESTITEKPKNKKEPDLKLKELKFELTPNLEKNEQNTTQIQYLTELQTLAPISKINEIFLENILTTINPFNLENTINLIKSTEQITTTKRFSKFY